MDMGPPSLITSTGAGIARFRADVPAARRRIAAIAILVCACGWSAVAGDAVTIAVTARAMQPGELILVTVTAAGEPTSVHLSAFGHDVPTYKLDDGGYR